MNNESKLDCSPDVLRWSGDLYPTAHRVLESIASGALRDVVDGRTVARVAIRSVTLKVEPEASDTLSKSGFFPEQWRWILDTRDAGHRQTRVDFRQESCGGIADIQAECSCQARSGAIGLCIHAVTLLSAMPELQAAGLVLIAIPSPQPEQVISKSESIESMRKSGEPADHEGLGRLSRWREYYQELIVEPETESHRHLTIVFDDSGKDGGLVLHVRASHWGAVVDGIWVTPDQLHTGSDVSFAPSDRALLKLASSCALGVSFNEREGPHRTVLRIDHIDAVETLLKIAEQGRCFTQEGRQIEVHRRSAAEVLQWRLIDWDHQQMQVKTGLRGLPVGEGCPGSMVDAWTHYVPQEARLYVVDIDLRLALRLARMTPLPRDEWDSASVAWGEIKQLAAASPPKRESDWRMERITLYPLIKLSEVEGGRPAIKASIVYHHEGELTLYEEPPAPTEEEGLWQVYELEESRAAILRAQLLDGSWTATSSPCEFLKTSQDFFSREKYQAEMLLQVVRTWPSGSWVSELPLKLIQLSTTAPATVSTELRDSGRRSGVEVVMTIPCSTVDGERAELDLLSFVRSTYKSMDEDLLSPGGESVKIYADNDGFTQDDSVSVWVHVPARAWRSAIEHAQDVSKSLNLRGRRRSTFPRAELLSTRTSKYLQKIEGGEELLAHTNASIDRILSAKTEDQSNWPTPWFKGQLWAFQVEAVNWAMAAIEGGFGGLIADERGLGKTVETLAIIAARRALRKRKRIKHSPTIIVVERKDLDHWKTKILEFVPALKTTYVGSGTGIDLEILSGQDIVLVTYTVFRTGTTSSLFAKLKAELIFLDEALVAKNPRSGTWSAFDRQSDSLIFPITGTPIDRNTNDLWALLELAAPGLFTLDEFTRLCEEGTTKSAHQLRERMAPFVLRRLKKDVAKELPPKHEIIQFITLKQEHATRYEAQRQTAKGEWEQIRARMGHAQARVALERRVLDGLRHAAGPVGMEGSKFAHLRDMLKEMVASGDRVLLFSEFNETVEFLAANLRASGIRANKMLGQPNSRDRALAAFKNGDCDVLVLSVRIGASGLDVPEATVVIVYDPWLNIGKMDQMGDRAHRLITTHEVSVYWLVSADTVESAAIDVLAKGQQNADSILDGGLDEAGFRWHLDEKDIEALLESSPVKG